MKRSLFLLFTMVFMALTMTHCTKDNGAGAVTIQLAHNVAGTPLELEQIKYPSQAGHTYSVVNLKYYLSEIRLTDKNGFIVSRGNIHLFDIQNPASASFNLDDIPDGDYTQLSFVFGLNEIINVDGGLINTLENINMEWPIPGDQGYHYMKFEGRYDSLNMGVLRSYNIHTGATQGNQNYLEISLPITTLALRDNDWTIRLQMDLNEWLQNPTTFDFVGKEMIMMNQAAQEIIKANGATVFSIGSVTKT